MKIPSFDNWSLNEAINLEEEGKLVIKTDGSFDKNLKDLQIYLNQIFSDLPKYSKDPKFGKKLDPDGRYGEKTKQRIKDFQLLLKMAFSLDGSKKVVIDGLPSPAVFYTAKDISQMGSSKAFSLK